ncbi:MAG TPA: flagellar hook-length control protein FliK, partial [Methylomirabilota bacterium]|nr:flagellar hook-length control protein FliK [Methylomirabilota bacterium]
QEPAGQPLPVQPNSQAVQLSGGAGQPVQQAETNGLGKLSVGDAAQGNVAELISGRPSIESVKEQSGTPKGPELAPIMIDASSREQVSAASTTRSERGPLSGNSQHSGRSGLAVDPLPPGRIQSAPDPGEPFQAEDLTAIPTLPTHSHRIAGLEQAQEVAPASSRELTSVTEQLVHAVRINVESGRTEARLHLEPPDLGAVRIQMVMDQQSLSLRFHAGSETTRALLEASLGELRDNLSQQGISVGQMSVGLTFDLANQNGGQLPAPWMIRDERWPSAAPVRTLEPQSVPTPQISLSALDLLA